MSEEPNAEETEVTEGDPEQPIEELMSGQDEFVDLDTAAWDAAEEWIAENEELAPEQDADADGPTGPASITAWSSAAGVDRILQVLLCCNLLLIGIVVLLPGAARTEPAATTGHETGTPVIPLTDDRPDPFVQPPRKIGDLPTAELWEHAVRAAGDGEYARAALLLEKYLQTSRMTDVERRLVYNQLAYYLVKDGRIEKAQDYERRSHQIMTRSYLPEDLLRSAQRAAEQGQLAEMRSTYARFLLQQKQIPPSLRKHVAEAYLKLGDSYRLQAEHAKARAEQVEFQRMRDAERRSHK